MRQYLGKGGLLEELATHIDNIIDLYVKMFNQDGVADYDLDENLDGTISVGFEKRYCSCCPGDEVGWFYISQAMIENPKRELEKLKKEKDKKQAEKDKLKKQQEKKAEVKAIRGRKAMYEKLREEFEQK